MTQSRGSGLPSSNQLADALLEAVSIQADLQQAYVAASNRAQIAKANKEMARAMAAYRAYTEGELDAKNEQGRQIQLDGLLASNESVRRSDQASMQACADLKEAEGNLEIARVGRSMLHELVDLRVSENGVDVAGWISPPIYDWGKGKT